MDCSKYKISFNGNLIDNKGFRKVLKSIQNSKILTDKGGFLFRSSITEKNYYIGLIPNFINGERSHHYDIVLDCEDRYRLTGFFNADKTLNILFTPPEDKKLITELFKRELKDSYKKTAAIFMFYGIAGEIELDWITKKILTELNMCSSVPDNLSGILNLD